MRGTEAVVAGHLDNLAALILAPSLRGLEESPADAVLPRVLDDDQDRDPADRSGTVDGHHPVNAAKADHLLFQRCDQRQLTRFLEAYESLADGLLVDFMPMMKPMSFPTP